MSPGIEGVDTLIKNEIYVSENFYITFLKHFERN